MNRRQREIQRIKIVTLFFHSGKCLHLFLSPFSFCPSPHILSYISSKLLKSSSISSSFQVKDNAHSAQQCAPILPALQSKCNNRAPAELQIASLHPHGVLTSHTGIHHSRAYLPGQLIARLPYPRIKNNPVVISIVLQGSTVKPTPYFRYSVSPRFLTRCTQTQLSVYEQRIAMQGKTQLFQTEKVRAKA